MFSMPPSSKHTSLLSFRRQCVIRGSVFGLSTIRKIDNTSPYEKSNYSNFGFQVVARSSTDTWRRTTGLDSRSPRSSRCRTTRRRWACRRRRRRQRRSGWSPRRPPPDSVKDERPSLSPSPQWSYEDEGFNYLKCQRLKKVIEGHRRLFKKDLILFSSTNQKRKRNQKN